MKKVILIVLALCLLTGCATIFNGSTQSIVFNAPPGTKIFKDGIKIAEVPAGYDAVSVRINKSVSGMNLVAVKNGYHDAHIYLRPHVNGVVFVNILLGPVLWVGAIVDIATGAAADMPNYVEIEMRPLGPLQAPSGRDTSLDHLLQF